jgi:hypothetical protein
MKINAFALLIVGVALGSASQISQSPSPEEVLGRQVKEVVTIPKYPCTTQSDVVLTVTVLAI